MRATYSIIPCTTCGADVKTWPSRPHRYCSTACFFDDPIQQRRKAEIAAEMRGRTMLDRICPVCGAQYQVWVGKVNAGRGTTCSRTCSYVLRGRKSAENFKGQRHSPSTEFQRGVQSSAKPFVKGMIPHNKGKPASEESRRRMSASHQGVSLDEWSEFKTSDLRKTREYKAWRRAVFERDDFTCQDCGERGGYLHADHIETWASSPDGRLDLSNGRTLCMACHYKRTFGSEMPPGSRWGKRPRQAA